MTQCGLETGKEDTVRRCMVLFYCTAQRAIMAGVITPAERDTISRVGTRKEGYWARHLYDLQQVLAERLLDKKEALCQQSDKE